MRTTCYDTIKRCPKPYSTISLSAKVDLIRLTPYHWQPFISNFRDITKWWLCKISCRLLNITLLILQEIKCSAIFVSNKLPIVWLSNVTFIFLHEILNSHSFLTLQMFKKQGYLDWSHFHHQKAGHFFDKTVWHFTNSNLFGYGTKNRRRSKNKKAFT